MKRRLDAAGKARWFKSFRNGGADQEEEDQDSLFSGSRELERPPVVIRRLKVYPDKV
jgi:hypothetical protein